MYVLSTRLRIFDVCTTRLRIFDVCTEAENNI